METLRSIIQFINSLQIKFPKIMLPIVFDLGKDQHTTQGKLAMMDTMGQAAALTGGYGSSYGQAVGQQAYQRNLQALMDKAPELYQLALNQHNAEGDELYKQASLAAGMEERDYGRYRDQVSDAQWDKSFQYQQDRDKKADEKWQAEFDEAKRQYDQSYALSAGKSSVGYGSYDNGGYENNDVSGTSVGWFDSPECLQLPKKRWL